MASATAKVNSLLTCQCLTKTALQPLSLGEATIPARNDRASKQISIAFIGFFSDSRMRDVGRAVRSPDSAAILGYDLRQSQRSRRVQSRLRHQSLGHCLINAVIRDWPSTQYRIGARCTEGRLTQIPMTRILVAGAGILLQSERVRLRCGCARGRHAGEGYAETHD